MGQKILHKSTRCEEKNNKKLKRNQKLDFPPINAFGENNRYKSFPVATTEYAEGARQGLTRNLEDPVWFTKPTTEINREMSELDKVSLNNLYRPCRGPNYSPTKFGRGITGLWYCGR